MTLLLGQVASSKSNAAAAGAVAFNGSTGKYSRSATGLGATFSWTYWVKVNTDRNTFSQFVSQGNGSTLYYHTGTTSTGTTLARDATSGAGLSTGYDLPIGTWVFVGTVNDTAGGGTDRFGYKPAGGTWTPSAMGTGATVTGPADANTWYIGSSSFNDWAAASIAAVKVWTVALTDAELQAEAATYAPVVTSGLWAYYKFNAGPQTTDDSGNGRTLTAAGTPTLDSSGPPII